MIEENLINYVSEEEKEVIIDLYRKGSKPADIVKQTGYKIQVINFIIGKYLKEKRDIPVILFEDI